VRLTGRFLVAIAVLAALADAAVAADTPWSLYRSAVAGNAAYLAARAGMEADQEGTSVALGQLLPNLSFSGTDSMNGADRRFARQPNEHFDYQSYSYNLNLRQPIYRKYNWALYRQAEAQAKSAESRFAKSGGDLVVQVFNGYLDALFADDVARLLEAQQAAVTAQLAGAKKAFEAGAGTRTDVDDAQAKYDMIVAQQIETTNQQRQSRRELQAMVNRRVDALTSLDPQRLEFARPDERGVEAWIADAENNNAELAAARAQVAAAEEELEKALSGHYPTVDLVATASKTGNDSVITLSRSGTDKFSQTLIGVQVNIPIYAGGQASASTRQARAKLDQARYATEDTRRSLDVAVVKEFDNEVQGAARIRAFEQAERSAQQALHSSRKGLQAGTRTAVEVLLADQQLFTARRDLAQARYQYVLAYVRLRVAAGKLSDDELSRVSSWFAERPQPGPVALDAPCAANGDATASAERCRAGG